MKGEETKLRNNILKALKEEFPNSYFVHIHGNPFQPAGIPDIVGSVSGYFVAIEVKVPGKSESKIQAYVMNQIHESGAVGIVAHSVEETLNQLHENCIHED